MKSVEAVILETLELVAERAGDPRDRIYACLFERHPEFENLFVMDKDGGVRANMLTTSLNCMIGVAEGNATPRFLLEAARVHHDAYGLGNNDIDVMFEVMRDVFRDVLGEDWDDETEAAWSELLSELAGVGREVS